MEVLAPVLRGPQSFSFASRARGGSLLCYIGHVFPAGAAMTSKQLLIKKLAPNFRLNEVPSLGASEASLGGFGALCAAGGGRAHILWTGSLAASVAGRATRRDALI
jgi:hypothetical protein